MKWQSGIANLPFFSQYDKHTDDESGNSSYD